MIHIFLSLTEFTTDITLPTFLDQVHLSQDSILHYQPNEGFDLKRNFEKFLGGKMACPVVEAEGCC
jgi:hypothetical protein